MSYNSLIRHADEKSLCTCSLLFYWRFYFLPFSSPSLSSNYRDSFSYWGLISRRVRLESVCACVCMQVCGSKNAHVEKDRERKTEREKKGTFPPRSYHSPDVNGTSVWHWCPHCWWWWSLWPGINPFSSSGIGWGDLCPTRWVCPCMATSLSLRAICFVDTELPRGTLWRELCKDLDNREMPPGGVSRSFLAV